MRNIVVVVALLVLLLSSCDFMNKKELCLEPVLDIHFNTQMAFTASYAGSFIDSNDSKEYFYFCNTPTDQRIDIFDEVGSFVESINLEEVVNKFGDEIFITLVSMDTILIATQYTNELIAINSNGDTWFYLNIDSIFPEEIQGKYRFFSLSQTSFSCNRQNLYFAASPNYNLFIPEKEFNNYSMEERTLMYYSFYYNSPYFLKLSNYLSDTISFEFGLDDIYHQICEENSDYGEFSTYKYVNNKLFFYSRFSNCLFIINPDNFQIEKKLELKSKFTKIGHPAITLSEGKVMEQRAETAQILKKIGKIDNVLFDNSYYYIVLKHPDLMPINLSKSKYLSFFSVIVLNDDFVFVDEFLFDTKEYNQYSGMMTQKGLAFQKTNTQNEKIYTVFNLF
ncbi:MAG: hypothetical protein PHE33_06295 [Bacteroidales bacterium]|nr:hypothetical protein [Bacteroidales bacterium]